VGAIAARGPAAGVDVEPLEDRTMSRPRLNRAPPGQPAAFAEIVVGVDPPMPGATADAYTSSLGSARARLRDRGCERRLDRLPPRVIETDRRLRPTASSPKQPAASYRDRDLADRCEPIRKGGRRGCAAEPVARLRQAGWRIRRLPELEDDERFRPDGLGASPTASMLGLGATDLMLTERPELRIRLCESPLFHYCQWPGLPPSTFFEERNCGCPTSPGHDAEFQR
jgi:hypothetical protein